MGMTTKQILQGVHDWVNGKIFYDVSEKNPTGGPNNDGKFTLDYILSNANTLIPTSVRKGGMSIKFVHTSDNKYVQYRLMSTAWSTNVSDWQGVDASLIQGSKNLVEGGAVYESLMIGDETIIDLSQYTPVQSYIQYYSQGEYWFWNSSSSSNTGIFIPIQPRKKYKILANNSYDAFIGVLTTDAHVNTSRVSFATGYTERIAVTNGTSSIITASEDAHYLWVSINNNGTDRTPQQVSLYNKQEMSDAITDIKEDIIDIKEDIIDSKEDITDIKNQLSDDYLDEEHSTFPSNGITSSEMLHSFIKGFEMLIEREEGYQYGVIQVHNGTPVSNYAYYIKVGKWPNNASPSTYNVTVVDTYAASSNPQSGTFEMDNHNVRITLDWSALTTTFGTGAIGSGIGTGVRFNQDVIFGTALKEQVNKNTEDILALQQGQSALTPTVCLPDKITAVVGDTLQVFFRSIIKGHSVNEKYILLYCPVGHQYPRFFELNPTSEQIGQKTFYVMLKDNDLNVVRGKGKTIILNVVGSGSSPANNKNIVCIGDSLTVNGEWVTELSRRLTGTGGSPVGKGFTNLTFCGAHGSGNAKYFGVGGWTWGSYATSGSTAYRFYVSGVNSLSLDARYTNNGSTFRIIEINVTGSSGNILCELYSGTNAPDASGTLTKTGGAGDSTITYSSSEQAPGNPFWDAENNKISFVNYANTYCNGTIDVIYALLGGNGLSLNQTDFTTVKAQIRAFADALHEEFPNAKLKVCGTATVSFNGGTGANYGALGNSDYLGYFYSMLNENKAFQEVANELAYSSFVEYVDVVSQIDCENNMQSQEFDVNTRNTKKELRDINAVHPALSGYLQIADVMYRNVIASFCQ